MAGLAALPDTANAILATFVAQLEAQGVPVPERQYVHAGQEAVWDGDQFTVGLVDVRQGQPGQPSGVAMNLAIHFVAEWRIMLVRAAPVAQDGPIAVVMPSDGDLAASGVEAMEDVAALMKAASQVYQQFLITNPGEGFVVSGCKPVGEQGGLMGTELLIETSVR